VDEPDTKVAFVRNFAPEVTTAGCPSLVVVLGAVVYLELKFIRNRQRVNLEPAKGKGGKKRVDHA